MGKCLSQLANPELSTGEEDHKRLSLKSTMDLSDEEEGNWPAAVATSQSSLRIFHEDILLSILSYVADVPFEMMDTAGEKKTILIGARCNLFTLNYASHYNC